MSHPRLSARSAPFLSSRTLRELSEAARAAGTGEVLDELWTARRFLDGTPAAVAVLDADLRYLYLNDTLAEVNGLPVEEHLGRPMPEVVPGSGPSAEVAREVLSTGRPQTVVFDGRVPDHTVDVPRWWLGAFHRLEAEDGVILGVAAVVMEVTEGIRQRESLRRAQERLELLEETATRVGGTLDAAEACQALTDLLVPRFADYAAVDVLDPEGTRRAPATPVPVRLRRMAVTAAPGTPEPLSPVTRSGEVIFHQAGSSMSQVLTGHRPVVLNRPDDDTVRRFAPTRQRLERYRALHLHSVAYLPLMVGGEPVGAVMLGRRARSPEFAPDDVELLELLTARAATGIGHALRYTHEHETALEMQRAFLATPHTPGPGVEIASRYLPAGRGAEVGGDWFDAVALPSGRTLLVVGDVMGHGVRAAAAMSEYRSLLRALALQGLAPDRLLTEADRTAHALDLDRVATCVLALLDPAAEEVVLATAGHVPPLLVRPGAAPELADLPVGPPLGTGSGGHESRHCAMPPGTLLLAYTDGLVERRGEDIDTGLAALAGLPVTSGHALPDILTTVVDGLAPAKSEDDVTLLAARTH
ncbi:PAS domain-containing protein [Streptomyces sp. SAI-133]|uniref:SpoIIE family protein phosphatase n=1 Tax=unclassified Streptomyces TaxID=2593676 RepID=UPI00247602CC|nr:MULTISPECIES: SpoIIE family protein phosphatase [unclassified Streptomyces]MDH6553033.1 PAS domain-containing protein [Streptomyces sp. SAI-041]MDH6582923.1 PAS domain-containing protein [Streptomyces sp. SAI-133]